MGRASETWDVFEVFEDTNSNFHMVPHDLHFLRVEPAELI
jgi:hypothetical protein